LLLRYNWPLPNLPSTCKCGQPFDIDHAQICKLGGFIHSRHDDVRDLIATEIGSVLNDVETEPLLQPLTGEILLPTSANRTPDARSDIRARGFWQRQQNAFFDVRIFYPHARCYRSKPLRQIFASVENEKKREYCDRILQIEHGCFTPLAFSANGGMGKEATIAIKKLATKISEKNGESYSKTMNLLRSRLCFSLTRSAITCIRGSRKFRKSVPVTDATSLVIHEAGILTK
jgi:hypothetical protein